MVNQLLMVKVCDVHGGEKETDTEKLVLLEELESEDLGNILWDTCFFNNKTKSMSFFKLTCLGVFRLILLGIYVDQKGKRLERSSDVF